VVRGVKPLIKASRGGEDGAHYMDIPHKAGGDLMPEETRKKDGSDYFRARPEDFVFDKEDKD